MTTIPKEVQQITDIQEFNQSLDSFDDLLFVLTFYTNSCSVCKSFEPQFRAVQKEFQKEHVYFARINVEKFPEIARQFNIMGVPYTLFIKEKEVIQQQSGNILKPQLRSIIKGLLHEYFHHESKVGEEFDLMFM